MEQTKEYVTKVNIVKLSKTIGALAKINIGLGLLMLLASVGAFVFTKEAHDAVDNIVSANLNYYRHGEVTEEDYESKLEISTFLRYCIYFGWKIGLVYCFFLMMSNVLLLIALMWNRDALFCCWMTLTLIFDLGMIFIIAIAFFFGVMLLDTGFSVIFLVTSLLLFGMPTIPLCCLVYKLYKSNKSVEEQCIFYRRTNKICLDSCDISNIIKQEVLI